MEIDKKLRSGKPELDSYIEALEAELTKRETSAIHKFIISSNKVAKVLAKDMELLSEGRIDECTLLNSNKDDKTVDRIMLMLKSNDIFKQIDEIATTLAPTVKEEAKATSNPKLTDPSVPMVETMPRRQIGKNG